MTGKPTIGRTAKSRIQVAVVGCGHLGSIHARLLAARDDVVLVGVVDPVAAAREAVAKRHGCQAWADPAELVGSVDAVVVAAPTGLHEAVAVPLLEQGIDLLVEKPIASTLEAAERIVATARRHGCTLAVGHVERFNPAWPLVRRHVGRPVAIEARRLAPFTYRSLDVGVVLDLMIHDIDLVLSLAGGLPVAIEACGVTATGGHEDAVRARLVFADGLVADLAASRINPVLDRSLAVWSDASLVRIDFNAKCVDVVEPSETVRQGRFAAALVPPEERPACRETFFSDVLPHSSLEVPEGNALVSEHDDFLRACRGGEPTVGGEQGLAALEVAFGVIDRLSLTRLGGSGEGDGLRRRAA